MRPLRSAIAKPPPGGLRRSQAPRQDVAGFTLVEMIVVMLLMAILAGIGASKMADREPFAVQGLADQVVSGLRLAQTTAIAQRQNVFVVVTASPAALQVCLDAACAQPLNTAGGDAVWLSEASGLTFSASLSFSFDGSGAPSFSAQQTVRAQNADGTVQSQPIRIEPGTGHVHMP
jgi:prepilin-type N-terminal cleavage/methylation domain-containing protein